MNNKTLVKSIISLISATLIWAAKAEALDWNELSPAEQHILLPFAQQWPELSEEEQQKLRRGAQQWTEMNQQEREQVREQYDSWHALPAAEQRKIRERFERFRDLPPRQQRILRRIYKQFQQLPPEQRRKLRKKFDQMTGREKKAFIEGLQARRQVEQNTRRQKLAQIPAEQRQEFRLLAAGLSQQARSNMIHLVTQMDDEQRIKLLATLSDLSEEDREAYLLSQAQHDILLPERD